MNNKLYLSLPFAISIFMSCNAFVFASDSFNYDKNIIVESSTLPVSNNFASMTNDELNDYISSMANSKAKGITDVKMAWFAAAQIARNSGYPCAATLVEYSLNNKSYSENNGIFYDKIMSTSVFKNFIVKTRDNISTTTSGSIIFNKNDNSDLFYALHNVRVSANRIGSGRLSKYDSTVSDVFDFAFDNNYDSLFTTLVNNWAWLCQQTHVLNKIPVTINLQNIPYYYTK